MTPRFRLALAASLLLAWTGWLAYQVARTADPIVVSRPQVFVSPLVIEASIGALPNPEKPVEQVAVRKVYRGRELFGPADQASPERLTVVFGDGLDSFAGWHGPGDYFLCLERDAQGNYRLTPPPFSPGFAPKVGDPSARPSIYPVTESTRAQLEEALAQRP